MMRIILQSILKHKWATSLFIFIVAISVYFGYNFVFSSKESVRYTLAQVEKGTLIVSVSGSGQVSASDQVDIKPKVSGDITYIGVRSGQFVRAGEIIAKIDSRDYEKTVRDSEISLQKAQLDFEKIKGLDSSGTTRIKQKAEDDLKKSYEDGFNLVSNVFLDLPDIMTGLDDLLFSSTLSSSQWNINYYADSIKVYNDSADKFKEDAYNKYQTARKEYEKNFADYKSSSRLSGSDEIDKLIEETYNTVRSAAEAVKSSNNLIRLYKDEFVEHNLKPVSLADTHLTTLGSYTSKTNTYLLNLLNTKTGIKNAKDSILNADIDFKSQELSMKERENNLSDIKEKLADYSIRASFGGIIAKVVIKKGDSVSANSSIAILVTRQKIAEITLNEVDIAKVKVGQKATLTFDAIPDLTLTGQVIEIDPVGVVSQGVVTYAVKIGFDTQDDRVKTAMSVSVAIVTEAKSDILLVPNSALKRRGEDQVIEIATEVSENSNRSAGVTGIILKQPPASQVVETGISNDEVTEIILGLKEGDNIIVNTLNPTSTNTSQQQNPAFRVPGLPGGGGGGGFRGR
ncbi:MAG: efflux RND transporter periplasmic adaptor subunit [bacterium]|nr:efflux RND transporter periplasmic adaptor subunit [bacterium]